MKAAPIDGLPREVGSAAVRADFPKWVEPMLATLTDERFSYDDWIFERKFDGERCLAFRDGNHVTLMSRNRKDISDTYPELVEALARQETDSLVVDGEVVAFEGEITSFGLLQNRMQVRDPDEALQTSVPVYYYLFDICYLDGYDVTRVPLRYRKGLLKKALTFRDPLRYTEHRERDGEAFFREVCPKGWEGLIAKDATAPYVRGRSRKWMKFKCVREQELVIGGFTDPERSRVGLGALLMGYYQGSELRYAGKVGTGYDDATLRELRDRLDRLEIGRPAYADDEDLPSHNVHWVKPELVAQVKFTEWTDDGKLRHPVFLGLRRDKGPRDVVKETS